MFHHVYEYAPAYSIYTYEFFLVVRLDVKVSVTHLRQRLQTNIQQFKYSGTQGHA